MADIDRFPRARSDRLTRLRCSQQPLTLVECLPTEARDEARGARIEVRADRIFRAGGADPERIVTGPAPFGVEGERRQPDAENDPIVRRRRCTTIRAYCAPLAKTLL